MECFHKFFFIASVLKIHNEVAWCVEFFFIHWVDTQWALLFWKFISYKSESLEIFFFPLSFIYFPDSVIFLPSSLIFHLFYHFWYFWVSTSNLSSNPHIKIWYISFHMQFPRIAVCSLAVPFLKHPVLVYKCNGHTRISLWGY